jgi:acetyltransferase-like isoleucine patch superfamily enzyme
MAGTEAMSIPNNRSRIPAPLENAVRALMRCMQVRGPVRYGDHLRLGRGSTLSSHHGLEVGDHVSIGQRTVVEVDGEIGDYCLIGRGVQIVGRNDHATDQLGRPMALSTWVGERPIVFQDSVHIGMDVWIGGGAIVLGGVTIGEGAIVGAGAVVTKDIEPFGIAVGNPAKVIRLRFGSQTERESHSAALRGDSK